MAVKVVVFSHSAVKRCALHTRSGVRSVTVRYHVLFKNDVGGIAKMPHIFTHHVLCRIDVIHKDKDVGWHDPAVFRTNGRLRNIYMGQITKAWLEIFVRVVFSFDKFALFQTLFNM